MFAQGRLNTLLTTLKRSRRRGTILLLVLGALAMVLILTVVYAALGKGDRTTGRAVNQQRAATEVVKRFGEHVAGIIGRDVNDLVPDMAEQRLLDLDPSLEARYRTETTDAPVSDFSMLSVPSEAVGGNIPAADAPLWSLRQFRPTGGHSSLVEWPEDTSIFERVYRTDPRIAADPWLASTRPTDFGEGSKTDALIGGNYNDAPFYARALDWLQISNVAPDGRFVNLAFMRDNFDAPSLDLTRDPANNQPRLTLFDVTGEAVVAGNTGFVLGLADVEDYSGTLINDGGDATPDWNVPAHWTMYQRNMARTIAELSREGFNTDDPNDPTYWEYSYADADGDGIIDSRWFELVDASSGNEVPLLGDSDRRYFAAVRVIDLSSLVNVNTATDTIAPPTLDNRAGQGPQDVSLFTLLTLDMHGQAVTGVGTTINANYGALDNEAAYASFFAPINGEDDERNDYEQMDVAEQVRFGRKAYLRLRESILDWQPVEFGAVPTQANNNAAWSTALEDYTPYAFSAEGPDRKREDFALFGSAVPGFAGGGTSRTGPFGVSDLIELLTFHGANDPEVFSALEQAFTIGQGDRDAPLHTRSLLRSDRTLAAEIGVQGIGTGDSLTPEEFNRRARAQLDIRSLLTTVSGSRPIRSVTTDAAGILTLSDAQRRIRADELMLGSPGYEGGDSTDTDTIRRLQNQARNPLIRDGFEVYLRTLAPHLAEFPGGAAWRDNAINDVDQHVQTLFYGYNGPEMALRMAAHMAVNFRDSADAPFVDVNNDGVPDPGTLVGVEENGTALEIVVEDELGSPTTVPYAERRDEPSRALLWLSSPDERDAANAEDRISDLIGRGGGVIGGTRNALSDDDIAILDADEILGTTADSVLASDASQGRASDAMIVYGVEAQPFLSEVFYMNAYWDAPRGNPFRGGGTGPDSDYLPDNPDTGEYSWFPGMGAGDWVIQMQSNPNSIRGMVNIDGRVPSQTGTVTENRDFLFQIVVFQLFNPFDVPVSLRDIYVEWAGAVYRPLVLGTSAADFLMDPGETRLLYATNPGNPTVRTERRLLLGISSRIDQIMADAQANAGAGVFTAIPGFANEFENVIDSIVPTSVDNPRIPLMRFDPVSGAPLDSLDDLLAGDQFAGTGKDINSVVHLWWDVGDRFATAASPAAARRDDILIDRMVDPALADPAQAATLDQRLRLETRSFGGTGGAFPVPAGDINHAFLGDNVDAPGAVIGGPEGFPILGGLTNLNEGQQRSVALWSRMRRFETDADATGSGGRAANPLGMPNGSASSEFPSFAPPPGAAGALANINGDLGISGIPAGALPAAAIETDANIVQKAEDVGGGIRLSPDRLNYTRSFTSATDDSFETALTLSEFFPLLRDEFAPQRNETIFTGVVSSSTPGIPPERYVHDGTNIIWTSYTPLVSGAAPGTPYRDDRLIQISHNSREFRATIDGFPQLRVGDLLNVLAVGPYRMPLRTTGGVGPDGYPTDPDLRVAAYLDQWTTLSEALGVAEGVLTNLEDPASVNTDVFEQLAGVLDRGHLRLDEFVPYFDFDADPATPFDPLVDRARGLGIPAALNIFDVAQAGGDLPDRAYGGIDRPVAGLININTAPPSVLRLLPGVYQDAPDEPNTVWPAWAGRLDTQANGLDVAESNVFFRGSANDGIPSGSAQDIYDTLDVASSILSYREPTAGYRRLLKGTAPGFAGAAGPQVPLNFGPLAVLDNTGNDDLTRGVEIVRDINNLGTRTTDAPGITALRRAPGFASIGELHAVRPGGDAGAGPEGLRFQFGMDWIARDRRTVSQLFIDPVTGTPGEPNLAGADWANPTFVDGFRNDFYNENLRVLSLDPSLLGDPLRFSEDAGGEFQLPVADQIPDDYDEQLIQMNMLANTVSTSSDFYAAWMVIHGFADDDVEDLDDNEPMRPSFRARYLMIVDRSNVVSRGDTPRVLAFLEVPYGEEVRNPVYTPE